MNDSVFSNLRCNLQEQPIADAHRVSALYVIGELIKWLKNLAGITITRTPGVFMNVFLLQMSCIQPTLSSCLVSKVSPVMAEFGEKITILLLKQLQCAWPPLPWGS